MEGCKGRMRGMGNGQDGDETGHARRGRDTRMCGGTCEVHSDQIEAGIRGDATDGRVEPMHVCDCAAGV
jgi:hypothetical protein